MVAPPPLVEATDESETKSDRPIGWIQRLIQRQEALFISLAVSVVVIVGFRKRRQRLMVPRDRS